jgi:hypothetical protein
VFVVLRVKVFEKLAFVLMVPPPLNVTPTPTGAGAENGAVRVIAQLPEFPPTVTLTV